MTTNVIKHSNTIQTVFQFKSYRNKHRGALSKIENNILLHLIERAPPSNHLGIVNTKINKRRRAFSKIHYSTNVSRFFRYWRFCYNLVCVRGAYFCPIYIEGGVLLGMYGLDSICRLYYIFGQLLHLWTCRMKIYTMFS